MCALVFREETRKYKKQKAKELVMDKCHVFRFIGQVGLYNKEGKGVRNSLPSWDIEGNKKRGLKGSFGTHKGREKKRIKGGSW